MNDFMKDRYGADELTISLGLAGAIIALIASLLNARVLTWIAVAVIIIGVLRALSKNTAGRTKENDAYCDFAAHVPGLNKLVAGMGGSAIPTGSATRGPGARPQTKEELRRAKNTAKTMWKKRKTHAFLKCPTCGQMLSVPKGKGKIRVTCPKCHTKVETKS